MEPGVIKTESIEVVTWNDKSVIFCIKGTKQEAIPGDQS
jgi:hypothetical protein